jgi:hypothetical protein
MTATIESPILKLTADDVLRRENPLEVEGLFNYGDSETISEVWIAETIAEQEDLAISATPEGYAEFFRGEVTGEILTAEATGSQLTTLQLTLFPIVSGSLVLYVDYGGSNFNFGDASTIPSYNSFPTFNPNKRPYGDRKLADRYDSTKYSVNTTTGAITMNPALAEGQSVYADYQHLAAYKAKMMRHLVLVLVCAEIYDTFRDYNQQKQETTTMRQSVMSQIEKLYGDGGKASGIQLFDKIKLVEETRKSERKALKIPLLGGM